MYDDDFMESMTACQVHSFIGSHIKDLAFVKLNLNIQMLDDLKNTWKQYAHSQCIKPSEYLGWFRAAKVQVVNAEKGLSNKFVKDIIKNGIHYDEACPTRYPDLLSGLMIKMSEELFYYIIHVDKYCFYQNVARISYALERKYLNLTEIQMCEEILNEQIRLLTNWKMEYANYVYFDRVDNKPQPEHTFYFAYGINCNRQKMLQRCPNAKKIGQAILYNHKFIIDERGPSGGCASVKEEVGTDVTGVLWHIPNDEIHNLDRAEGINLNPPAYKKASMKVHVLGSSCFECEALVYVSLRPEGFYARTGYIEGILEGIKEDLVQNVDEKSYRCHIKHD